MIRLSVIMPARNEAACIAASLEGVFAGAPDEVLVVDGQSDDATADIAHAHGARVIASEIGRGRQLAAGIAAARGDVLLFVHADTRLPADYVQHVTMIMRQHNVALGAFRLRIDADGFAYRLIERAVHWRSTLLRLPYGDQGIFLRRDMARRIDNLADFDVMEDVQLVRQARQHGRIVIAPASVLTSARQWQQQGVVRATFTNLASLLAFQVGVSPSRIARWRFNQQHRMASERAGRTMTGHSPGIVEHDQRQGEG